MAEYTEVVEVMNEVHKEKGGTYDEQTASRIVELAGEFFSNNKEEVAAMSRGELELQIEKIYEP